MDHLNLKRRAADIVTTANVLSGQLAQLGLPEPSFQQGLPPNLLSDAPDSNANAAKHRLLQLLDEFRALLTEPARLLSPELVSRIHGAS